METLKALNQIVVSLVEIAGMALLLVLAFLLVAALAVLPLGLLGWLLVWWWGLL